MEELVDHLHDLVEQSDQPDARGAERGMRGAEGRGPGGGSDETPENSFRDLTGKTRNTAAPGSIAPGRPRTSD